MRDWLPGPWRWFPRRCVDCNAWHLNGPRVPLPLCRGCFRRYIAWRVKTLRK